MNRLILVVCCVLVPVCNVARAETFFSASINTNITTSIVKINATIASYNSSGLAAIASTLPLLNSTLASFNQTLFPLLTKYASAGVSTNYISSALSQLSSALTTYANSWNNSLIQGMSDLQGYVLYKAGQIRTTLLATAESIATKSATIGNIALNGNKCYQKYGAMLITSKVSADRLNTCVANEIPKTAVLATNATTLINFAKNLAPMILNMVTSICSPSIKSSTCVSAFFGADLGMLTSSLPQQAYAMVYQLINVIAFRTTRCLDLVYGDVQALAAQYDSQMTTCMTTGV
ncbi:uncharacterized protein LOC129750087 [Uranotaenia lowii]|uniref:uncharacterized protein LOC129750087 n=1 Tax=Uranotaenia lowii TaxID=190385 RepID=UPI00247B244F|nr:uncharacterized protein LOC129750087 [Uranotaenia lowii]